MQSMEDKIKRINELYHRSQTQDGLSQEEKEEQARLRKEYIASIRANLRGQLNQISIIEEDGTTTDLKDKFKGE